MPRLIHHFLPFFSFGLELDEAIAAQRVKAPLDSVQQRARELLEQARQNAQADGKRAEQVESAVFACVAWFDEIVTRNPGWWGAASPLQVALFNTNNAGNEFFHHLSALRAGDDEVREVYYHALVLGFVGQYYFETGDNGELGKIKELHGRQLPVAPAPLHTLREEPITPQPYQIAAPGPARYPRQWDRLLLKAAALVALLIPLGYLAWLLLAAPRESGPTLAERIERQLQTYGCSDLAARLDESGGVTITGHVSRPDDIARVQQDVQAIDGVRRLATEIGTRIWPHCEVVALLGPYQQRSIEQRNGLQVTPTTGHSDRFSEGERVVVKLIQAHTDGYLYVDYYTVDGSVIHLYPNRREPDSGRVVRAAEQFNVGQKSAEGWIVGPPFGQELITVISSPTPLYEGELPEYEPASSYLPQLRTLLDTQRANPALAAQFLFLQTEPASAPAAPPLAAPAR
ncbi:DUF4384 domain-containing protein [Corticibacter populi]|uniref:DUF4384 domain-containing protein n=1 Tax=Corticibacter populi TaxID=1550736 RepID=A0A3M6QNZ0_9BURK|nr:DotU family type IV/VI secretion system protein [Corticibacter populi]RMX04239.1 DUF4384 domain-containing protein [Corticibacter populi]RZS33277.1 type IV/VI secretion system ImpK/VasF family protein [Corticibacter populi]